jgi:MFS family permease
VIPQSWRRAAIAAPLPETTPSIRLGLGANWRQFALLVVVNAFVGAMVGLERTVVPLIARADFGLVSETVVLSFLVSFGLVKALANLFAGQLADRIGRKPLLVAGWLAGLPVPLLLIWAPTWGWVVFANVLLGVNQGLCWSTTVVMKIDLVGRAHRGLAMGVNEFAGYVAVSLSALVTGYIAAAHGLRPAPFYPGIAFALLGLVLSVFAVRETHGHARTEGRQLGQVGGQPRFVQILLRATWHDRALFAASQAGLVNNMNDGMVWGLIPVFLAARGVALDRIGVVTATYPLVWGMGQLATGALSDRWGRKWMIASGMWVQAVAIAGFVVGRSLWSWLIGATLLGIGTALVYPTLLAAVADVAHPDWRASAVGVYRLWRDAGYAVGAITVGLLADAFSVPLAIIAIAALTFASGVVVAGVMHETLPQQAMAV